MTGLTDKVTHVGLSQTAMRPGVTVNGVAIQWSVFLLNTFAMMWVSANPF